MMWQDVPVQLVDLPAISADFVEEWVPSLVRSADAALLVANLASDDVVEELEAVLDRLAATHTELVSSLPYDVDDEAIRHIKTLMVGSKLDAEGAQDRLAVMREAFEPRFPIVPVSTRTHEGLETLCNDAYHVLGVLRVYTKVPGKPADKTRPFTLPIGSTVLDLARDIHQDFAHGLKSARIWGTGVFEGQSVKKDHELHDADVVELHLS
jgi:ribosome-interacting GTPase 1